MNSNERQIAITVDVEDWPQSSWDRDLPISDYCAQNARTLLSLFSEFPHSRMTFFVLGKFAEKHPEVVKEIQQAGHEIASHGYGHVEVFTLGKEQFGEDLKKCTFILEDLTGSKPRGYRAPDFSIVAESLWALDVLAEQGYQYDSSIFPINKERYGIAAWPTTPSTVQLASGRTICEFPLTTISRGEMRLPISGGGYARLLPTWLLLRLFEKARRQQRTPPVFYCHPYEIDHREFSRLDLHIPLKVSLHQNIGRKGLKKKLRALLDRYQSVTLAEIVEQSRDLPVTDYTPHIIAQGDVRRPSIF